MLLGLALNLLPLRLGASILLVAYGVYYGVVELLGRRGLPSPSTRWQVPQSFVRGGSRLRRILVWGAILGPGFASRNPYAGFASLPIALAALGRIWTALVVSAAIGIGHGTGRAIALLRDARGIDAADYFDAVFRSLYWRSVDGALLLALAGAGLSVCIARF